VSKTQLNLYPRSFAFSERAKSLLVLAVSTFAPAARSVLNRDCSEADRRRLTSLPVSCCSIPCHGEQRLTFSGENKNNH